MDRLAGPSPGGMSTRGTSRISTASFRKRLYNDFAAVARPRFSLSSASIIALDAAAFLHPGACSCPSLRRMSPFMADVQGHLGARRPRPPARLDGGRLLDRLRSSTSPLRFRAGQVYTWAMLACLSCSSTGPPILIPLVSGDCCSCGGSFSLRPGDCPWVAAGLHHRDDCLACGWWRSCRRSPTNPLASVRGVRAWPGGGMPPSGR